MKKILSILLFFCALFNVVAESKKSLENLKNQRKTAYRQKLVSGEPVEMQEVWGNAKPFL